MQKTYLLSCLRDEGPFILEFVAHHLTVGFSQLFIASNDCSDGSDALLDALQAAGYLSHLRNAVAPGEMPQRTGYRRLRAAHAIDAADWVMVLDLDEFLNVHTGDRRLAALTGAASADVDLITLNAATFGAGGQAAWTPALVTARFTTRLPARHKANGMVKTLFRNPGDFGGFQNHSPVTYRGPKAALTAMRASGATFEVDPAIPLWRQLRHFPAAEVTHDLAQVNHYAVKTWDSFCLRQARGRGAAPFGTPNDRHDRAYFEAVAPAADPDDTIAHYRPATEALIAEMRRDPAIAGAEAEAHRRYRARLATLR